MRRELHDIAAEVRPHVVRWVEDNVQVTSSLCGACGIASYALWKVLLALGYEASLVHFGDNDFDGYHCWVEVGGWVVDITATQFEGPEVAVFRLSNPPEWVEQADRGLKVRDRLAVQELAKWGVQSPRMYQRRIRYLVRKLSQENLGF